MRNVFKALPESAELGQLLDYDAEAGLLTWRERAPDMFKGNRRSPEANCKAWNTRFAGKSAANVNAHGYASTIIDGKSYQTHRLVWVMHYGRTPEGEIDHINGSRSDNRIVNLRDVTGIENARNAKRSIANSSGSTGVCWYKKSKRWRAHISGKHLGLFRTIEEAIAARKAAEIELGFHPNHGKR